jgi:hypothetical protein
MQPPDRHCESLNARNRNARLAAYRPEMQRQPKFGVGRSRLQIHLGRLAKAFLIRQVPRLSAAGMLGGRRPAGCVFQSDSICR